MKSLSLAFLLTILVWHAAGQTDKPITNWKTLDQLEHEFSLEVPDGFEFGMPALPFDKIEARGEFHSDGDRFYIFIDSPKERDQRKQVEAFLAYSKQDTSKMDLAENVAARADFEDSTGYYHRVVFVKTQSRIFTLQTVSLTKDSQNALRFLNSFRLLPRGVPASLMSESPPTADEDAVLLVDMTQTPTQENVRGGGIEKGGGQGTGLRSGEGYGQGLGSGTGSGSQQTAPPKTSSPLKILSKQKAQYTDFARFYNIQGVVTLRVAFLASGQIGTITTIKKLPLGLTETANYAARGMKFEPEVANGVARTTTRPVTFTFNIY
jgi:hypothetical protein